MDTEKKEKLRILLMEVSKSVHDLATKTVDEILENDITNGVLKSDPTIRESLVKATKQVLIEKIINGVQKE